MPNHINKFKRPDNGRPEGARASNVTPARAIAITSGKGGVGKTNFALNLAIALSGLDHDVLIFDADMGLSNVDILAGIDPQYTAADVILGDVDIQKAVFDGPSGTKILSGGTAIPKSAEISRQQVLKQLSLLEKAFNFVLIDTAPGLSTNVMDFVLSCKEVILITTPEPTTASDTYAMIKLIISGYRDMDIKLLINRASSEDEAEDTFEKMQLVVERFLERRIGYLGFIPEDESVSQAVAQREPFLISKPSSQASQNVKRVAARLLTPESDILTAKKSLEVPIAMDVPPGQ